MSHSHTDMSGDMQCQMEMIWNWNTIGSCFLSSTWYIRTEGMMAASVVGVALLAMLLELCRRAGNAYDAFLSAQFQHSVTAALATDSKSPLVDRPDSGTIGPRIVTMRVSPFQQLVRAIIHAITYSVAYIIMLLVMSFNGYIILSIFAGAGLGKFLADWMEVKAVVYDDRVDAVQPLPSKDITSCCL